MPIRTTDIKVQLSEKTKFLEVLKFKDESITTENINTWLKSRLRWYFLKTSLEYKKV